MAQRERERAASRESPKISSRLGADGQVIPREDPIADIEWDIHVEFEEIGGRLYPRTVVLEPGKFHDCPPGGITARLLHSIRLGELIDEFRREHSGDLEAEALFLGRAKPSYRLPPPANRPGPRGLGEEHYQDVAVGYLKAVREDRRRPIVVLARSYRGHPVPNVRDWVALARRKGYLTEPGRGRGGGEPTEKLLEALRTRGKSAPRFTKRRKR
jgi:hypothetical protein